MENQPFYIVASIFISIVLIFTLVLPKYQDLAVLKEEILLKKSEFQSQEKYFQDLKKIAESLMEYATSISKIDYALPPEPYPAELLNFIQKVSSQSGLSLKAIDLVSTTPIENEKIKESRVKLGLIGDYPQLKNFLSILENSARVIEVENISFVSSEKEIPFEFNLTLKVYSY